jgi:hypothetical protein
LDFSDKFDDMDLGQVLHKISTKNQNAKGSLRMSQQFFGDGSKDDNGDDD